MNIRKKNNILDELDQTILEFVLAFRAAIDSREPYKTGHSERVTIYALKIGKELKLSSKRMKILKYAAFLHDIGKIGVTESTLKKPGRLSSKGAAEVEKHCVIAKSILNPIKEFQRVIPIIYSHHEQWDGKGYPVGLKGEEIPVESRIISVVDTYDALTSNRPYRRKYSKKEAIKTLRSIKNKQLDGKIVDRFISIVKKEK